MNWYQEIIEGQGKSGVVLYPTPGIAAFMSVTDTPERGEITTRGTGAVSGRTFTVMGSKFYEGHADGSLTGYGIVVNDAKRVSMAAGPTQILLASAGAVYVFDLIANTLTLIPPSNFNGANISFVGYCDGFFIVLQANSNELQVSALLDATSWDLLDVAEVSEFPDNVLSMLVDHDLIWLYGATRSVVYFDAGAPIFPFSPIPGSFIEQGIIAPESRVSLDNSVFWLGGDERGAGIAWRANGYTPQRVSTHATEFAWQGYGTIADAVGYSYQDQGHSFWVLYFPAANKTWVFDAATNQWHERGYWNATNAIMTAHHSWGHTYNFGKHLVGDPTSGRLNEMSISIYSDLGNPIRRVRRSAPIASENQWIFHHQVQIDCEVGLGSQPPLLNGDGTPRGPQLTMDYSDDGGKTWSNELTEDMGQAGKYNRRVMFWRLGRSRDRVYRITGSDPVPYRIIEGYLEATPGFTPAERIPAQYRKVS